MKDEMFDVITKFEIDKWELINLQKWVNGKYSGYYATLIKDGIAIYLELSDEKYQMCTVKTECPLCGKTEDEECDCGVDYVYKKDIDREYR